MTKLPFPKIMGILNVTPDSFSDGIGSMNSSVIISKAKNMIATGVDIIDIGGETTKPGSDITPANTELDRILPIIKFIKEFASNIPLSIDTRKAEVAKECLKMNVDYINDVSGLQYNPEIATLVANYGKTLIIMHSKDTPKNMQDNPYYDNVVNEVFDFLKKKINFAKEKGVESIIGDVGIGFAKTTAHNLELLKNCQYFEKLNVPMLLGISRKRFIGDMLNIPTPKERDIATMFIHSRLLDQHSIKIIRTHNTTLASQLKNIYNNI